MAKITKPLTNTEVKQVKPKEKVYTLSDGGGLQLRVKPNGSLTAQHSQAWVVLNSRFIKKPSPRFDGN